jgi:hypothetical protein
MAASKKNTVTSASTVLGLAGDPLSTAYQDLRCQLVGGGGSRSGGGLALLLNRGMWEWVQACGHLLELVPQRPAERTHAEEPLPSGIRAEIVVLHRNGTTAFPEDLMTYDAHQKVSSSHLKRDAYLYVRQSTLRQVFENTESTRRQYALKQQGTGLGTGANRGRH